MKTTLEIPDFLFREAKASAARNGQPLRAFVSEAIAAKLAADSASTSKPWMKYFGSLRHLHAETERLSGIINEEFESIDAEGWK